VPRVVKRKLKSEPKPTLLWVEDDTLFLRETLQVWKPDLKVKQATSSPQAFLALRAGAPDLVVLDLAIPSHLAPINDEEGFALLFTIRQRLKLDVPIVVVSRFTDAGHRERALEMGADAYLTKPVKLDELEAVIEELLMRNASDSPSDEVGKREDRGSD
jgi:DNA-binding response OmpR family regulator